jgi:hypothetical protein
MTFCLVVDDFGVKYVGKQHADHLLACLQELYTVTKDWSGSKYCGLTIDWNYPECIVTLSMPGYIAKALQRFQHQVSPKPEHSPHPWTAPTYGANTQYSTPMDATPKLDDAERLCLQEIIGTLLYYARAVDCTMLVALGSLSVAKTTNATAQAVTQLLNYTATHPDAVLAYHASDMMLHVHSDASYLSESQSRCHAPVPHITPPPLTATPIHHQSMAVSMSHVLS